MTENVVTQNLRNFTVQIRPADSDVIVGTGMVVSADGKIVTCAHVVKSAGAEPRVLNGKELSVYFPQALGGEKKAYTALQDAADRTLARTGAGSGPFEVVVNVYGYFVTVRGSIVGGVTRIGTAFIP